MIVVTCGTIDVAIGIERNDGMGWDLGVFLQKRSGLSRSLLQDKKTFAPRFYPVVLFFRPTVCQPATENPRSDGPDDAGIANRLSARDSLKKGKSKFLFFFCPKQN